MDFVSSDSHGRTGIYNLAGTSYDSNGNLTNDTFHTYTWDSDSNTATIDSTTCGTNGTCLTFDASDRVVEKNVAGTIREIEYSPIGKVAVMSGTTQKQAYVPLPGGEMLSPSIDAYWHTDWLGTVRLATAVSARTVTFDRAFSPFGEIYDTVIGDSSKPDYTGDTQDTVSGEFDTPYRELHPGQGRWISPDPAGVAAADPTNPQSWNRYAYVMNSPLNEIDPTGLECVWDDGSYDSENDPETGNAIACQGAGGTWIELGQGGDWSSTPGYLDNGMSLASLVAQIQAGNVGSITIGINGLLFQTNYGILNGNVVTTYYFDGATDSGGNIVYGGGTSIDSGMSDWVEYGGCCTAGQYGVLAASSDIWHDSPQCPNCADLWQQANCVANKPFTTAADDVIWAVGGAAFVGASASHSGVKAMLKGAVEEVGADVLAVAAVGSIYFHASVATAYSFVAGCKSD